MQYRSNLPRPFHKGAKTGNRKVISSTSINGKTVCQQVVYQVDGHSVTRHERVQVFYIFPTSSCQDWLSPIYLPVLAFFKPYGIIKRVPARTN